MARDFIFISYSHADRNWVNRLGIFFKPFAWGRSYKDGGRLWADPYIQTGDRWHREITDALGRTRIAVLLVSQNFLASDFITREELPPILAGARSNEIALVCIPIGSSVVDLSIPELLVYQWPRPHNQPLDTLKPSARSAELGAVFRDIYELATRTGIAVNATAAPAAAPLRAEAVTVIPAEPRPGVRLGELKGVPAQRPHHVERPEVRARLKAALLSGPAGAVGLSGAGQAQAGSSHVGLFGQGGLGKTVSAIELVNDVEVRQAFPDGIYWLTIGQTPNLTGLQSVLIEQLAGAPAAITSVSDGSIRLGALLSTRACLIVLDDVWRYEHARAFDVMGGRSRLLVTTRDESIVTALGAADVKLDVLGQAEALAVLATWADRPVAKLPIEAKAVAKNCGYLPLALSVAGAMIRDGAEWNDLLAAVEAGDVRFLEHPYGSVFSSLQLSVDALSADARSRYLELCVVLEDVAMPVEIIAAMWARTGNLAEYQSRRQIADFERKGLLYLQTENGESRVLFHDLQHDFLQLAAPDVTASHRKLLDALAATLPRAAGVPHRSWWAMRDTPRYLWEWLGDHLAKAEGLAEWRSLLFDYRWMREKLRVTDVTTLTQDYESLPADRSVELVRDALRLSNVLASYPAQLAPQLYGRLRHSTDADVARLLAGAADAQRNGVWLCPITASLIAPGGALIRTLTGHQGEVHAVALTPDGERIVSAGADATVRVWNRATGEQLNLLDEHRADVRCVTVTPDGRTIVSADDHTIRSWDADTAAPLRTIPVNEGRVRFVAISPDSKFVIASCTYAQPIRIWDLESGELVDSITFGDNPAEPATTDAFAITAGSQLWVAHGWKHLEAWNLNTRTADAKLEAFGGTMRSLAVSPNGRLVAGGLTHRILTLWDVTTGVRRDLLGQHTAPVNSIAFTTDGRCLITASQDESLAIWDVESGTALGALRGHANWVTSVAITLDNRCAVSASSDGTLKVWDLTAIGALHPVEHHQGEITCAAASPDGRHVITGSADKIIKVWDRETGALVRALEGHAAEVTGLAVTPNSGVLVSSSNDKILMVWDLSTGDLLRRLNTGAKVSGVSLTPDGSRAVSSSYDKTVKVWDLTTGSLIHTLTGHTNWVRSVLVTPDGTRAISSSWDGTVRVWDLSTGQPLGVCTGHSSSVNDLVITADGMLAVSAAGDEVIVWNVAGAKAVHKLSLSERVLSIAVSPDGRFAAAGGEGGALTAWDLASGELAFRFSGHDGDIHAVAVTNDGRWLISASADGTVRAWSLSSDDVAAFVADGPLTKCVAGNETILVGDTIGCVLMLRLIPASPSGRPSTLA
jgi:WD40 repeat protein